MHESIPLQILDPFNPLFDERHTALDEANEGDARRREWRWPRLPALGRDDGRYADSPLKSWFETLGSEFGQCCTVADGYIVSDPDWESDRGQYRVRLDGEWVAVPDGAVITQAKPRRAHDGLEALHQRPSTRPLLYPRQHDLS